MLQHFYTARSVVFMGCEGWRRQRLKSCVCVSVKGTRSVSDVPGHPGYQAIVLTLRICYL